MKFSAFARLQALVPHAHLVFEVLAYFAAFSLYRTLRDRTGDPIGDGERWTVIAAAGVGAALGSKILYWWEDPAMTLHYWKDPAYLTGGETIVGALIGGLVAVEIVKRIHGITRSTGDPFAVPLTLGIAIGRVGCFLTGLPDETAGTSTRLPWGVDFGDGILRHPTQLYEIAFLLALGYLLWRFSIRGDRNGEVFKLFMVGYMGFRLLIEFIKPFDTRIAGLTAIQWACILMLAYYQADIRRWLHLQSAGSKVMAAKNGVEAEYERLRTAR